MFFNIYNLNFPKQKSKFFLFFIIVAIFFAGALVEEALIAPAGRDNSVIFSVENGQSLWQISSNLEKADLIKSRYTFFAVAVLSGKSEKLQAGYYQLSPAMGIFDILEKISSGELYRKKVVLLEGWTVADIGEYLQEESICPKELFLSAVLADFSSQFDFLKDKPKDLSLEGYIFPDTYEVSFSGNAHELILKALQDFDLKLTPEMREEIARQKKTVFDVVRMASIIEKEVNSLADKKIVSGILWKRLDSGMPLQVDATVLYALGNASQKVSIDDTETDSPYNTYNIKGLPLGPISNPGLESIIAAIYPEKSSYWYYLSTPSGKTIFNKTFSSHLAAKIKYLR